MTFKVDNLVRVNPRYQTDLHRSDNLGHVVDIKEDNIHPVGVQFKTYYGVFAEHELEKI